MNQRMSHTRPQKSFKKGGYHCPYLLFPLLIGALVLTAHATVYGANLLNGFTESLVSGGLSSPTAMAFAPDGRLFVLQQGGQVRVIKNGNLLATPFVSLTVNANGERGLLGIAFDPNFAANHFVYVYYTATSPAVHNRVSRFTANGDVAQTGSELRILDLDNLSSAQNHNGGAMHFGSDGKLYIAVGENANSAHAQTLNNLLGKMLRINKDGTIPADNPFYEGTSGKNRAIWALGLRNPFTFSVQPGTGRIFINDVGQSTREEINDGFAGANYGWPTCEGVCNPPDPDFHDPFHTYANDAATCAITGGTFYNPPTHQFPAEYTGDYFFADFCGGWIRRIDTMTRSVTGFATNVNDPVDLQVGADGSLYYLARGDGAVYKVEYSASQAPSIIQHPVSQTEAEGEPVSFSVDASGSAPLSYQWQRDDVDIAAATSAMYTLPSVSLADDGARFRVIVSNAFGSAISNPATLTVIESQPTIGSITRPAEGTLYKAGEIIPYLGTATDSEGVALPASAFTWKVDFHHDTHVHPFLPSTRGQKKGSFKIPTSGETATNVWYRVYLTVTDAQGIEHTTFRDIFPRIVTLTVATDPSGLQVTVDGQPHTTPHSFESVVGITRTLSTPTPQTLGDEYLFRRWSNGKQRTHNISTPAVAKTYTATFRR